jgi:Flp pilus assembly protein TadG
MKHNSSEKGQALILIALAMIGLVGFSALTIDGGRSLSDRRNAQNAADSAALSAALAKINNQNYTTAAQNIANSNGYNTDADSTVVVNLCSDSGVTCEGLPSGADSSEYIRVRITSIVPTTFARVIGRSQVTNTVEAITRVQGSTAPSSTPSSSPSSSGSFFNGAAMVATKGGNNNQCFLMNGSADLYTHNSGIYVNCSGTQALFMNGGSDLQMDATGQVVGCYAYNGGASFDPIACIVNGGVSQTIDATTFEDVPTTQAPPTCGGVNGSASGTTTDRSINGTPPSVTINSGKTSTLSPGNFDSIMINGSGATAIFSEGTYCISGNFNLNGNSVMSGPNGRVVFVLQNQNIVLNGGSTIDFNDLEIYGNNSSFLLNGNAIFRADRMRIFFTGNGTFTVNGGSELSSDDAYFYLKTGNITWNGSSILDLQSPPQGDPFAGLLVHMPWNDATSGVIFNGGSNIHLTGTFLAPRRPVTFNGGVNFELHSQIIGYTYIVNGGGDVDIYFQADENYSPPNSGGNNNNSAPSATIELTK